MLTGLAGVARPAGAGATAAIVPPTTPRRAKTVTPVNIYLFIYSLLRHIRQHTQIQKKLKYI